MSDWVKCPKCGVGNDATATSCRHCKRPLEPAVAAAPVPAAGTAPSAGAAPGTARSSSGGTQAGGGTGTGGTSSSGRPQVYSGPPPSRSRDLDIPEPKSKPPIFAIGGVAVALVLLLMGMKMLAPKPVEAIETYDQHIIEDKSFQCLSPKGWEEHSGARSDGLFSASRWEEGSAKVMVEAGAAGSFMSEGLKRSPDGKSPQQILHERDAERMSREYSDYAEETSQRKDTGFGETWVCEFRAEGGFRVGPVHGIRATALSSDKCIKFLAVCRESDWDKLKPGFEKIYSTLGPGGQPFPVDASVTSAATPAPSP